jgi:hypothetical protein
VIVVYLVFAGLRRRHAKETLVNGFMDMDKAKELCPEIFDRKKKKE